MKKTILVLVVLLVGCSSYCPQTEYTNATGKLSNIFHQYVGSANLALSTPRIQLSPVIQKMQGYKDEYNNTVVPECLERYKSLVIIGMEYGIDAFIDFLGNKESSAENKLEQSTIYFNSAIDEANKIQACVPNCKP